MRARVLTLTTVVGSLMIVGIASPPPALAHAHLESSAPRAGATLDDPPGSVRLTFNEAVESDFARIEVTDPSGERVDVDAAAVDGDVVTTVLRPSLQPGRYTVAFRVVSLDGHPIDGDFRFTLTAAADTTPSPPPSPSPSPSAPPTPNTPSEVPPSAGDEASPSELPAAPTSTTGDRTGWSTAIVVALLAAAVGGGTYLLVRRRTSTP